MANIKFKPDLVSALCGSARKHADAINRKRDDDIIKPAKPAVSKATTPDSYDKASDNGFGNVSNNEETKQDDKSKDKIKSLVQERIKSEKINLEKQKSENAVTPKKTLKKIQKKSDDSVKWDTARKLFPKQDFPWHVFPDQIATSLKQLARSCATSPSSLPGAAISILASSLGSTLGVSPKYTWNEPLIFWFGDIRPSGSGKTPSSRALCDVLYDSQVRADKIYKELYNEWQKRPAKERGEPPERSRSYFITDLTLEGIRQDLTGHGGTVCIMDELSTFISSQNQYKQKGNDRECWLNLWDGKPARYVRASMSHTLVGARVNIFGGIQPRVWQEFFGGKNGLFLEDGTIYRFLPVYEGDPFFPLTDEAWSSDNKKIWDETLLSAIEWSDYISSTQNWETRNLILSQDAQKYFFNWRNDLFAEKNALPSALRGFLPKAVSYALRLSAVLYCFKQFISGASPGNLLSIEDIKEGIETAIFYMGQTVDAIKLLCSDAPIIDFEITEPIKYLGETLKFLENDVDNGRLGIGFICETYNKIVQEKHDQMTPRAMGAFLRSCSLNIAPGIYNVHGKRAVRCLEWDSKMESFFKILEKEEK